MNYRLCRALILGTLFVLGSCYQTQPRKPLEFQVKSEPQEQTVIKHDPIEDDPRYKTVFEKIDAEVYEALKNYPMRGGIGFVHVFWDKKKKILKEEYGIDWRSPAEMNPNIFFD